VRANWATQRIVNWLNDNLTVSDRPPRTQNLWIHGPPLTGKTQILNRVLKLVRGLDLADNNGWIEGFKEGSYDLMFYDEFSSDDLGLSMMKRLSGGYPMNLFQRGQPPVRKVTNIPMFVTAQSDIRDTYLAMHISLNDLKALESRFLIVDVSDCIENIVLE